MKADRSLSTVNHQGTLLASDVGSWARYLVKFLQQYSHAGVPVAAITPQNEPTQATTYPGLELPEASEADWTRKDLEPASPPRISTPTCTETISAGGRY